MENVAVDNNTEKKVLNVIPVSKGKRFSAFLGDFFINFILAYLLFAVVVMPIAKKSTNYWNKDTEASECLDTREAIMYENKLLFRFQDNLNTTMMFNASYTFYCYFSYFVYDEVSPEYARYNQYGHKAENDIFRHFYLDIVHDSDYYYKYFDLYNSDRFFERSGDSITLTADIRDLIFYYFDKTDSPTAAAGVAIETLENNFFYPMYSSMMLYVEKISDLYYNGASYNTCTSIVNNHIQYQNRLATYASFITLFLSTSILYVLVPFLNKNRKTLTMMVMKIERVDRDKLEICKKPIVIINFIYSLLASLIISFIIPTSFVSFYELFNIPVLMIFGLFSLLLQVASLIFLLFNSFSMDLFDYLTRSVLIKTETLDDIYRAKGYYI